MQKLDKKAFILNHEGSKYKIRNCSSLEEIQRNVQMQLELTTHILKFEYLDSDGEYYVATNFDGLEDGTNLRLKIIES